MEGVGLYSKLQLPLMGCICRNKEKFSTPKGRGIETMTTIFKDLNSVLEMTHLKSEPCSYASPRQ